MMLYALTGFANYSNRVCRVMDGQSISGYLDIASGYKTFTNINFKNGDGISTTQVVNVEAVDRFAPDYLLVCNDDGHTILSRWYVVECAENRLWQYTLTLRRDLIADNWRNVVDATSRINRGWCSSLDSAIYNPENISVNQIKKDEVLLKDETGCAWVVGYLSGIPETDQRTIGIQNTYYAIDEPEELTELFEYYEGDTFGSYRDVDSWAVEILYDIENYPFHVRNYVVRPDGVSVQDVVSEFINSQRYYQPLTPNPREQTQFNDYLKTNRTVFAEGYRYQPITVPKYSDFVKYQGRILKDRNNNYYKIKTRREKVTRWRSMSSDFSAPLLSVVAADNPYFVYARQDATSIMNVVNVETVEEHIIIEKDPVNATNISVTIPQNPNKLKDRPYYMFCMPMDSITVKFWNGTDYATFTTESTAYTSVVDIGAAISKQFGANCMDIQLLPYCPCVDRWNNGMLDLSIGDIEGSEKNKGYALISEISTPRNIMVFCNVSSVSTAISHTISTTTNTLEKKTRNLIDKYRLASPNYASMYEFSPYMNDGVETFTVDFTYCPYAPYIRVAPMFSGLYGSDFGDCRGLVCRGDFSMPQINDSWANYINNNKNYAAIFDRNIDTLKFNRNMSAISSGVGIAASIATTAATGNPMGLIGIGSQLAGGVMGLASSQRAISDTQYLHNLEMENIQAQPNTISNVGTFTINNKIFPILELYSCTDEEVESVKAYLNNFSFTINRQGKIRDYLRSGVRTWIEADLIAVPDFKGDAHELMELKNELTKGVYIV